MQQRLTLVLMVIGAALTGVAAEPKDLPTGASLSMHVGRDGYLSSFEVTGPFPAKLAQPLFPSTPINAGQTPLAKTIEHIHRQHPPRTHLRTTPGMQFTSRMYNAVLLDATLTSPAKGAYWLTAGTVGPIAVFLNGALVHRFDGVRNSLADTDLIPLTLEQGENRLVVAMKNVEKRWWRAFFRLLGHDFAPATDVLISHPPPDTPILTGTGVLKLHRRLDTRDGSVTVSPSLVFAGGRPDVKETRCEVSYRREEAPVPHLGESKILAPSPNPAPEFSPIRFDADPVPDQIVVKCNGEQYVRKLAFTMRHARDISIAAETLRRLLTTRGGIDPTTAESLEWRVAHLIDLVESGDEDFLYLTREIRNTKRMIAALEQGDDPYFERSHQVQRRGYRSPLDGRLHPYVLYVPPLWREKEESRFGLVVVLHGLNAPPMKAMQSVFGKPLLEGESKLVKARHPEPVGPVPYFVLAPSGFGPSGYQGFGEQDVMEVIETVKRRYRINPNRIYITGPSMGGIGAAAIPLHHPDLFAAAAPLCGYHSMFAYRNIKSLKLTSWETFLLRSRSNADWAANGRHLPLYVVHGLKDSPGHSRVLVSEYQQRGYPVTLKTPDLGHNVWDTTYAGGAIFRWFAKHKRNPHPERVTFTTARRRYKDAYWVSINDVPQAGEWSKINAEWKWGGRIEARTSNISRLTLRNDDKLRKRPVSTIAIDDTELTVPEDVSAWHLAKQQSGWTLVESPAPPTDGLKKRPGLEGPIDDALYEPLLFVYSSGDPAEERLTKRLVRALRKPKRGVTIEWPIKKDTEVTAEDIRTKSLVIVGTPGHNALLAEIHDQLPIRVQDGAIVMNGQRLTGDAPATAFIYPNPLNRDRYVVIYTATTLRGLFFADHLPQTVPDYIVYDGAKWHRKRERALTDRPVLAAGFFDNEWGF